MRILYLQRPALILLCLSTYLTSFDALKRFPRDLGKLPVYRERTNSDLAPKQYPSLKMTPALKLCATFFLGIASATIFWNSGRQFETVDSIPKQYFKEQKTIEGQVVKVTDGDTIR